MPRPQVMVVDTGLGSAHSNLLIDRNWLAEAARGARPNLLRFHRSTTSVWLGRHQWPDRTLDTAFVRRHRLPVLRRATGGSALYVDSRQLCWSLVLGRSRRDLPEMLEAAGRAMAVALCEAGLDARFEAPNDVLIGARKVAGVFGARYGAAVLLQGFVLVDIDGGRIAHVLRYASEGHDGRPRPARDWLTGLAQETGRRPSLMRLRRQLTDALLEGLQLKSRKPSKRIYVELRAFEDSPERLPAGLPAEVEERAVTRGPSQSEAIRVTSAGLLYARLALSTDGEVVSELTLGGDVHFEPADLPQRLGDALAGIPVAELAARARAQCAALDAHVAGADTGDLVAVCTEALSHALLARRLGLPPGLLDGLQAVGGEGRTALELVAQADAVLVPYCAKAPDCSERHADGCHECGRCEVGEVRALARQAGLSLHTLVGHDDLFGQLEALREQGARAVIVNLCEPFVAKHRERLIAIGLPLVMLDLAGANCHRLGQEAEGYAGRFPRQVRLEQPLIRHLLRPEPKRAAAGE